jgi:hypothetical protein
MNKLLALKTKNIFLVLYSILVGLVFRSQKVLAQTCVDEPDQASCESTSGCIWTESGCARADVNALGDYIANLYNNYLLPVGSVIAVGMLVYAGIKYTTSSGNPDKIAEAKDVFVNTLIGLVVLLLAGLILALINPNQI